jgi:hypothetical protein
MYKTTFQYPFYGISRSGEIVSFARCSLSRLNAQPNIRQKTLRVKPDRQGYLQVSVVDYCGQAKTLKVHQLTAMAWLGYDSSTGKQVNHIDGDKSNNKVENLELVSPSENVKHAYKNNLMVGLKGESNPSSRITEAQAKAAWDLFMNGLKPKQASVRLGIPHSICKRIYARKSWKHICIGVLPKER